jgi:hypothetical protein
MQPTTPAPAVEPVDLLLLAVIATAEALAVLIAAAAALLLTLAGWRPAGPPAAATLPPAPLPAPAAPLQHPASPERVNITTTPGDALAGLRVVELRRLARAAGHRQLARSGRRAELLQALAAP